MDTSPTRTCKKCELIKPPDQFPRTWKGRWCRECYNAYMRVWQRKHPKAHHDVLCGIDGKPLPKVCRRCSVLKSANEYKKDGPRLDGLSPWCAQCQQEYYDGRNWSKDQALTERHCLKCERSLPISEFGRNRKVKGGYHKTCKWCERDKGRMSGRSGRRLQRVPPVFMLSDIDKGYVAALLDGEGSISLGLSGRRSGYRIRVEITNTNLEVMYWLVGRLGGRVYLHAKETVTSKRSYRWGMAKFAGVHLLRYLRPHLIIKLGQADAAIRFEEMERQNLEDNCRRFLPTPLPAPMQALIDDVTRLNHRGPTP